MKKIFTILVFVILIPSISKSQTWEQRLNGRSVWSLAYNQNRIFAGGLTSSNSRIWISADAGNNWDTIYIGAGQTMWDFGFNGFDTLTNVYVANFSNGLLKSTNNGSNFSVIPGSVFNNKNLQGVECGSDGYIFVTSSSGFFRSTDNGQTFIETALTGLNCLPVIVDRDSSNIVYVGVSSATGAGIGVYRSTDNGLTFSNNLNPGKNGYNLYQKDNGELFMITTTSPYNLDKSTDKGLTWATVSNLPQGQRGISGNGYNEIYTTGNGGVHKSFNNGLTFENYNFTISATPALFVNFNNVLKILVGASGTTNGGVWMRIEGIIQNARNENENVSGYELSQNYPNPFNPKTIIKYAVTAKVKRQMSNVKLSIYDVLGNEVVSLVNEKKLTGSYEVEFDGSNFPSGVYYYSLSIGIVNITKKMLLIK